MLDTLIPFKAYSLFISVFLYTYKVLFNPLIFGPSLYIFSNPSALILNLVFCIFSELSKPFKSISFEEFSFDFSLSITSSCGIELDFLDIDIPSSEL